MSALRSARSSCELNALGRVDARNIDEVVQRQKSAHKKLSKGSDTRKSRKRDVVSFGDTDAVRCVYEAGWRCVTGRTFEYITKDRDRAELSPLVARRGAKQSRLSAFRFFMTKLFMPQLVNMVGESFE